MHELSIARRIIEIAEQEMQRQKLDRLSEIGLKLGVLSGIDRQALDFSFEAATTGTTLENTSLAIELVPLTGQCSACRHEFDIHDFTFVCPVCGSGDISVTSGQELEITHLVGDESSGDRKKE